MKIRYALSALALLAVSATSSANLVSNGDFSAAGADWTVTGNTGLSSFPGYWRDGAFGSNAYLNQTIATVAGDTYEVSFDTVIDRNNIASGLDVVTFMTASLDGVTFITADGSGHYDVNVVAANSNAVLTFASRNDPNYNQLDNVVVNDLGVVPEPGSLALLGLGIVGLFALRKKSTAA